MSQIGSELPSIFDIPCPALSPNLEDHGLCDAQHRDHVQVLRVICLNIICEGAHFTSHIFTR